MKKKFVVALVAAMSLTVAGTGTVFAMDKVSTVASEKEHVHGDNCEWIVDKEAWTETVEHPEEGHYEEVVVQEAWDEEVTVIKNVCHNCGYIITSQEDAVKHLKENYMNGCQSYGQKEFTEIIHHEAVVEQQWKVDKPSWTETVEHPEEGHWVCNGEPQEPEQKPENPDVETPDAENPETPEQKPEANKENVPTQAAETKKEGTTPKTGDTASSLPVAGAGIASLGVALATILKKRK